jgi:ABC-type Fe3+/spermidine/putrescine transport system ATPase subunit
MSAAELEGVRKVYGDTVALAGISLEVGGGELLVLLGASGSGKTTALRVLAGLETPDEGIVRLEGRVANDPRPRIPPEKRGIGMVFQDLALWPHLSVRGNLEFVLEGRKRRRERRGAAERAAETAGIAHRLDARPGTLSGGERQRVAIARALVLEPRLLLFDEPLTGLDEALRLQMRDAIVDIQARLGVAAVYVTHHPEEALSMATRVVVLEGGRILCDGAPTEVYARPGSREVATVLGSASFLAGTCDGRGTVSTPAGAVSVLSDVPEGEVFVVVRPRSVRLSANGEGLRARVRRSFFEGEGWRVVVDLAGEEILVETPVPPPEGEEVRVEFETRPAVVGRSP